MIHRLLNVFNSRATAVRELVVGGISWGCAHLGLTAPAGGENCTCERRFFPDALDVECAEHGLRAFYLAKLAREAAAQSDVVAHIRAVA